MRLGDRALVEVVEEAQEERRPIGFLEPEQRSDEPPLDRRALEQLHRRRAAGLAHRGALALPSMTVLAVPGAPQVAEDAAQPRAWRGQRPPRVLRRGRPAVSPAPGRRPRGDRGRAGTPGTAPTPLAPGGPPRRALEKETWFGGMRVRASQRSSGFSRKSRGRRAPSRTVPAPTASAAVPSCHEDLYSALRPTFRPGAHPLTTHPAHALHPPPARHLLAALGTARGRPARPRQRRPLRPPGRRPHAPAPRLRRRARRTGGAPRRARRRRRRACAPRRPRHPLRGGPRRRRGVLRGAAGRLRRRRRGRCARVVAHADPSRKAPWAATTRGARSPRCSTRSRPPTRASSRPSSPSARASRDASSGP